MLTVDLMYSKLHVWGNMPYTVRVPRVGSTFSLRPAAISQLSPHLCGDLIASQTAYWLPNKYLPYTLAKNETLADEADGADSEALAVKRLPLTPLSSVKIGTRCKGAWEAIPVANLTRNPIDIQLSTRNRTAEVVQNPLRSIRCPFSGRTATLEATCDYGPTRRTTVQVGLVTPHMSDALAR